jgi:hypothetical protein
MVVAAAGAVAGAEVVEVSWLATDVAFVTVVAI